MSALSRPTYDIALLDLRARRARAGWIDVLLVAVMAIIISFIAGGSHAGTWTTHPFPGATEQHTGLQILLKGAAALITLAVYFLYYFVQETFWGGRTIGKHLMGVRVVDTSGDPANLGQIVLRTVFRTIDVLPAFYLVGYLTMRYSGKPPRRIGDFVAGTTVALAPDIQAYQG